MATGGASGGGYVCSQGLLYGIYAGLLIMHGVINSFGGKDLISGCRLRLQGSPATLIAAEHHVGLLVIQGIVTSFEEDGCGTD